MTDGAWAFLAKALFGGSILLIIYIVYSEVVTSRIKKEQADIKLGEEENANTVKNLSDNQLVDKLNEEFGIPRDVPSRPTSTEPTSAISGSSSTDGRTKKS